MSSLSYLENKKILILGLGEEGIDNLLFFKNHVPYKSLGVADIVPFKNVKNKAKDYLDDNINLHLGRDYLHSLKHYDVIVKSPGIPFSSLKIKKNQLITSQSDIFISSCGEKVIGITGTKGKSTVSCILNNTLQRAGVKSRLVGNIGEPVLSYLAQEKDADIFVYELSSFQLQTLKTSPHIAVFLNIFIDHLDKHKNFNEYLLAKENITRFQKEKDFFIYNNKNDYVKEIAKRTKAKKIPFSFKQSTDPLLKVLDVLKIEEKFLWEAFANFKGLTHRMEDIGVRKGIHFYNDSASTVPEATIKAINEVKNVQTVILGGIDKGSDVSDLVNFIIKSNVENTIIFEGTDKKLVDGLRRHKKRVFLASSMKEAVDYSFSNTKRGRACLLSPGFASFNMFKNKEERGDLFKQYVNQKNEKE